MKEIEQAKFHGRKVMDMDRGQLLELIQFLADEVDFYHNPGAIRRRALGAVCALKINAARGVA